MGVLGKLATLSQSIVRQSAEVIIDANAISIFEQEIIDVENNIVLRKKVMSEMLVARKQLDRECDLIENLIAKRELQAKELFHEDDKDSLIDDIVEDIAQYEETLADLKIQHNNISKRIFNTKAILIKALSEVTQYRRYLRLVKAQQVVNNKPKQLSNLPEQLSKLESTRQHIAGLQYNNNDQEDGWAEMEEMLDSKDVNRKIYEVDRKKRKEAVLARIKK